MAGALEDLKVYQKAKAAGTEISAIIQRSSFVRDARLREQLGSASERCSSSIAEGNEQSTDKHFAQYCYRAKGSAREVRNQLHVACDRLHITEQERAALDAKYLEIARMLSGLIRYLEKENRKNRAS